MNAQGYHPKITLAKDNESEIRMLKNGKDSCTARSKHVAIKYFWSTDRIKNGDIQVKHCPTEKMLADYMSKPVQGSLFIRFRRVIMGWAHISTLYDPASPNEERVENKPSQNIQKNEAIVTIDDSGHKRTRMTYAQALKCKSNVARQDKVIGLGIHPTNKPPMTRNKHLIKKKQSRF